MEKYNEMLTHMKQDVTKFFNHFEDSPANLSGWGHNYFCEIDGGKLQFKQDSPKRHVCEVCEHGYSGKKYDDAWVYLNRLQSFTEIVKSAYLYKETNEEKYLSYARDTLLYYAENYADFELHVKDKVGITDLTLDVGGAAKIMPQGLNEGYMLIKIIQALDIFGEDLDEKSVNIIKEKLIRPAIEEVLAPQLVRIHNIACWISCAIAAAGFHFKEEKWLNYSFTGPFNIENQLKDGVTKDKLWYEGSIHYHFFMLESVMNLLVYPDASARLTKEKQQVKAMLVSAYNYAFDNMIFPNPNDGWANINLKTYVHVYHMAAKVFDNCEEILQMISNIESAKVKRMPTQLADPYYFEDWPLEKLLYNSQNSVAPTSTNKKSYLYEDSNFAMLRNDRINLFLKFGHNSPSHAHPDKMTFELTIDDELVSRDLSNAGYGAQITNEWYRMSASHNTIVVDGKNHDNVQPGRVLAYAENHIAATCAKVYPDVDFTREFKMTDTVIQDKFTVTSEHLHNYDYFLHIDGDIRLIGDGLTMPGTLNYEANGYQHLKNVVKVENTTVFECVVKEKVVATITVDNGAEIFMCDTLDNPVSKYRKTLVLRKSGTDTEFNVTWNLK